MPPFGPDETRDPRPAGGRMLPVDLPDFPPDEFAAAVRRALRNQPPPDRNAQILAGVVAQLSRLASEPDEWPALAPGERRALLVTMMLAHGFAPEGNPLPAVAEIYLRVAPALSPAERVRVVQTIAQGIRPDAQEVRAFLPAMFADADPTVVSTAALEYALLTPADPSDIMAGVRAVRDIATNPNVGGWQAGAILGGGVIHGDHRALGVLDGAWRFLDHAGKEAVTTSIRPGLLLTGAIEFYLRWLEDPDEMELGLPASIMCWLPEIARGDGLVREVERSLPANYHATPEENRRTPPVRVLRQWPIPEYGRIIMPRLAAVWEREGRPEPMRDVMRAWGG